MEKGESTIAPLAGANMPADRGLTGLGLLMQFSGSIFLAFGAFMVMMPMLSGPVGGGSSQMTMIFVAALCMVRSAFHRSAGRALLYGSAKGPLHPVKVYIGVALAQSALLYILLGDALSTKECLHVFAIVSAWPVTLALVLSRPQFRKLGTSLLHGEDMGFESAAVMMTIFGILGAMTTALVMLTVYQAPSFKIGDVPDFLMLGMLSMLLVRSIFHAKAGFQGCQGVRAEQATASAARYFNFGIMSAIIASGIVMLQMLMKIGTLHFVVFGAVGLMGYLLLIWPLMLRTFYTDRNFSMLIEDQEATRRAPDTGLTALGWLLLALGSVSLASALGALFFIGNKGASSELVMLGASSSNSQWLNIGLAALQTAAGYELIRMSPRHKLITTIYGAATVVATLYLWWPVLKHISEPQHGGPFGALQLYGTLLISLAPAVSAMILVNRATAPDARARFTDKPTSD